MTSTEGDASEPTAEIHVRADGVFAVLPDGSEWKTGLQMGLVGGGHTATDQAATSVAVSGSNGARGTTGKPPRDPVTGRWTYELTAEELERGTLGDLTSYEKNQRLEVTKSLRQRGWSHRAALSRSMEYVQALRVIRGSTGLRLDTAVKAAPTALAAASLCTEILHDAGHDTLYKNRQVATESPLDAMIDQGDTTTSCGSAPSASPAG